MPRANTLDDLWRYVDMQTADKCWPWKGPWGGRTTHKMPYFSAGGQRWIAYRKVYEEVNGVTLLGSQMLCHSCDNGSFPIGCCNPYHVAIGTPQSNVDDAKARDRFGMPRATVRMIRKLLEQGRTQQSIADIYGCSRETISAIATGRTYQHVEDEPHDEEQGS